MDSHSTRHQLSRKSKSALREHYMGGRFAVCAVALIVTLPLNFYFGGFNGIIAKVSLFLIPLFCIAGLREYLISRKMPFTACDYIVGEDRIYLEGPKGFEMQLYIHNIQGMHPEGTLLMFDDCNLPIDCLLEIERTDLAEAVYQLLQSHESSKPIANQIDSQLGQVS